MLEGNNKDLFKTEVTDHNQDKDIEAGSKLLSYIDEKTKVGDLLSLEYSEAIILVHDALRQEVRGLPMGCFLLATRIAPDTKPRAGEEDTALILLRIIGHAALPNRMDTDTWRFDAARRSIDSPENWDADNKTDQFTLNQLRHAGVRCSVLGTFRYVQSGSDWKLTFGADISNFYSGQGMKVYKPIGPALTEIVNFTKPMGDKHPLAGKPVPVGRVRYSSSEIAVDESRDNVPVNIEPTDMLARRTTLFGMSRSGKSNTIKTIASSIFKLRDLDIKKGRVGQLIFDLNGEYCNDNPQDEGCLRNIGDNDVVTYGLFEHPHDEGRRLIKINFFGEAIIDWTDKDNVISSLTLLFAGKEIINEHLRGANPPLYVQNFINTNIEPPTGNWDKGIQVRYRRNITVYRAILSRANFTPPSGLGEADISGLFSADLREAMGSVLDNDNYQHAAETLGKSSVSWNELYVALTVLQDFVIGGQKGTGLAEFIKFNQTYQNKKENKEGKSWNDDTLNGLLSLLQWANGVKRIRELQGKHSPSVESDYSTKIVEELVAGNLVIVDQSIGSPNEIDHTSKRIMWELFNHQKQSFTDPPRDSDNNLQRDENGNILPPTDVIVYVEEAHVLLPSQNAKLDSIWARIAKEGSKYRIGLVYSTQEPSSILTNILKNTDNWFVAHLNNQDETRELKKYYDFEMFTSQILKVPDTGFLRMRCLSNPYIVPVQINKFKAPTTSDSKGAP